LVSPPELDETPSSRSGADHTAISQADSISFQDAVKRRFNGVLLKNNHLVAEEKGEYASEGKNPPEDWNLGTKLKTADTAKG